MFTYNLMVNGQAVHKLRTKACGNLSAQQIANAKAARWIKSVTGSTNVEFKLQQVKNVNSVSISRKRANRTSKIVTQVSI